VISIVEGQAILWGFTKANLHKLNSAKVSPTSKIVPFFSPAENTQVIILEPEKNFFRIYEH